DFGRARELIIGSGAVAATLDTAGDYADRAKAALQVLPAGPWRAALEALADFAVSRATRCWRASCGPERAPACTPPRVSPSPPSRAVGRGGRGPGRLRRQPGDLRLAGVLLAGAILAMQDAPRFTMPASPGDALTAEVFRLNPDAVEAQVKALLGSASDAEADE